MKKSLKNYLLKTMFVVLALLMSFPCIPVKAATGGGGDIVSPNAYYDSGTFTFSNWAQDVKSYDGTFMAVEVGATSTTGMNEDVTVKVYVDKTGKTHTYTIKSNGLKYKFDYIYLGLSGGSDVRIRLECSNANAVITAKFISYSW